MILKLKIQLILRTSKKYKKLKRDWKREMSKQLNYLNKSLLIKEIQQSLNLKLTVRVTLLTEWQQRMKILRIKQRNGNLELLIKRSKILHYKNNYFKQNRGNLSQRLQYYKKEKKDKKRVNSICVIFHQ